MVHHNECPLCQSENIGLLFRCTDNFISKEEFELYKCQTCNFIFTQDYPEENAIGQYYESDDYISHSNTSKGFSNKLYRLARNTMLRRKREMIHKTTSLKKGRLLDIGSGTGHFANTMKEAGWDVNGIEINEKARNFSASQFGLEVMSPDVIHKLEENSFDCITLWHVLEHFHEPFKYAAEIKRLLKPGGLCLIALPNSNSPDAKYYGKFWAAYDIPRHLWHFTPDTFRIFAEKTGFMLEEIRRLPLDVFYISTLSEKQRGSKFSFVIGLFRALPFAFSAAFNRRNSSSVIYLLRKTGN